MKTGEKMFEKLKSFFKKIFGINDLKLLEDKKIIEKEEIKKENEKEEFLNSIIIVPNEQKEEAIKLQKQYQQGILDEEELTDKQYIALSNLYHSQIDSLKQEITEYKQKIESLKQKLV